MSRGSPDPQHPHLTSDMLARLKAGDKLCCRDFSDFLMAFLDGELGGDIACRFDQHLAKCPPCKTYVETYRATVELAKESCCPKANPQLGKMPQELVNAILHAVTSEKKCE